MVQDTVGELVQVPAPSSLGGDKDMSCLSEMAQSCPHALLGEEGLAVRVLPPWDGTVPKGSCCWGDARRCPTLSQALWGCLVSPPCGMDGSGVEVKVWMSQGSLWS